MKLRPTFILFIFVVCSLMIPTIVMATEVKNIVAEVTQVENYERNCDILEGVKVTFIEVKPEVPNFIDDVTVIYEGVTEETVATEVSVETAASEESLKANEEEETDVVEIDETKKWNGEVLTCKKGYVEYGPTGYETWYDLNMSTVVKNMKKKHGIDLEYWIDKETGLKMYGDYIMVAADVRSPANPDGIFEYGDIIEVSHGKAMVVDCCRLAINKRKNFWEIHIDIATDWEHTYSIRN